MATTQTEVLKISFPESPLCWQYPEAEPLESHGHELANSAAMIL